MEWSQIIITFISGGAFLGLFLIAEKNTKAQMSNMQQMLDNYKKQSLIGVKKSNEETIINNINPRTLLALLLRRQGEKLQLKQSQLL